MGAVVPRHLGRLDQPQVGLIDERSCLQRVTLFLAVHVMSSQPVQLLINERRQLIERLFVSAAP